MYGMPKHLKIICFDSVIQKLGCYHDFEVKQNNCMQIIHTALQQVSGETKHHIQMHRLSSKKGKTCSRADVFSEPEAAVVNLAVT